MNIFEQAISTKLRFKLPLHPASLTVEDLYDLPLQSVRGLSLEGFHEAITNKVSSSGEASYITKKSSVDPKLTLSLAILERIIDVRLEEHEKRAQANTVKERKQALLAAKAMKEGQQVMSMSIEDLDKALAELT